MIYNSISSYDFFFIFHTCAFVLSFKVCSHETTTVIPPYCLPVLIISTDVNTVVLIVNCDIFLPVCPEGGEPKSWLGTEGSPQRENPQQRLRWQAHLEFTHNHTVGDLTWDLIAPVLPRSERLHSLVLGGIPHSMRPQVRALTCDWNTIQDARSMLKINF